jgi:hypothetical protein
MTASETLVFLVLVPAAVQTHSVGAVVSVTSLKRSSVAVAVVNKQDHLVVKT